MDNDLDMSWIQEYSRIHSIQQIMNKEELDTIVIQTIYMNTQKQITKTDKETIVLNTGSNRYISKEQLLKMIQNKKQVDKIKYTLFDMLLFTLDLEPKDIQKYVNGDCNNIAKLKSLYTNKPSLDNPRTYTLVPSSEVLPITDIVIPPSLFIFHSLHTFFLLFIEIERTPDRGTHASSGDNASNNTRPDIKSILKTTPSDKRHTKKVRIADVMEVIQEPKHKKTRKNIVR